jgi:pyrimidine-nucleoside phosphorylase
MESIHGFRTNLTTEEFLHQLRTEGLVLTGQTADLAPADGKLYALRDVTGTVPSIPLIASSIMSKKIAGGARAIVLDVKVGRGAFMETLDEAAGLARLMVAIARLSGRRAVCLLSDMNQPLGYAVGNAVEVREAIDTLHLHGPRDFYEHCLEVASQMLLLGEKAGSLDEARYLAESALKDGRAWQKFRRLVEVQGGDVSMVDEPSRLPAAAFVEMVPSPQYGWLKAIDAREVGETAVDLGAGRARKEDIIDRSVGIIIHHKVGDRVGIGEPLFTVHASSKEKLEQAKTRLLAAHQWSDQPCPRLPLFYDSIS